MVVVMSGKTNFSRKMDEIKGLVNWKMEKEGLSMWIEKQRLRSEGERNNNYGFHDCGGCAAIGGADRCGWCKGREDTNLLQFYFSLSFFFLFDENAKCHIFLPCLVFYTYLVPKCTYYFYILI